MELYRLRTFVAVAEDLHAGWAAARLHLTQPTVSRQIAALEANVGVRLFTRDRRRLGLTPAGQVFLAHAKDLVSRADTAVRDAGRAARGEIGTLRIGFVQSAVYEALPRILGGFRSANPDVGLTIRPMTTLQQLAALRAGALDAGLLRPQQPVDGTAGLGLQVISRDRWTAVLPAGHRLARRRSVPLAELAGEDFVLYAPEAGSTGHDQILDRCAELGFVPRIVQEAADAQTTVALVAAGLGVSLLLSPVPPIDPVIVSYRPLRDPLPLWDLAVSWSEGNDSAVLRRFLTQARTDPGAIQVG